MKFDPVFAPIVQGNLVVRLAENEDEVEAAQRLRYRIFCEEMGASANQEVKTQRRDFDQFDAACHHVLVLDESHAAGEKVVGTYRLLTRSNMAQLGHFYTEGEYDIAKLKAYPGEIMELGRSCVEVPYRTRPVIQMLWKGIGAYVTAKNITLMFGCASFNGTDPKAHQLALAYLYHFHLAPEEIRPRALEQYYTNINLMAKEAIDARSALAGLPPLIKGYLRLGGFIGDGAVVDHAFNTTDVSIVVRMQGMADKYTSRYTPGD
ncbi:MAG: GNAT family N-acetyltransferase [Alphaproteobacteria bacterium]|jgi:putative hemolysin